MSTLALGGLGPRTRVVEAAHRLIAFGVAEVGRHEDGVLGAGEPDPEVIHDMRVATRRLRGALRLIGGEHLHALATEVKQLQDALGSVRDLQVQREWLVSHRRPRTLGGVLRTIEQALPARVEALRQAVVAWRETCVPALMGASEDLHEPGRLGGHRLRERLADDVSRLDRRMRAVLASADAATAHLLRIATKKLRYHAELLTPALGRPASRLVAALELLQGTLGELHDADVRLAWLEGLAASSPARDRDALLSLRKEVEEERTRLADQLVDQLSRWQKRHRARRHRRRILH